jgi:hypothetical protein
VDLGGVRAPLPDAPRGVVSQLEGRLASLLAEIESGNLLP